MLIALVMKTGQRSGTPYHVFYSTVVYAKQQAGYCTSVHSQLQFKIFDTFDGPIKDQRSVTLAVSRAISPGKKAADTVPFRAR